MWPDDGYEYNVTKTDPYGNPIREYATGSTRNTAPGAIDAAGAAVSLLTKANPLMAAASTFGVPLLKGVASLFKGESWGEKKAKELYGQLQNRLNQPTDNPMNGIQDYMRATQEERNARAESINSRLGLDSGAAQGEMMRTLEPGLARYMLDERSRLQAQRNENDMNILGMMAQLTRA